jgi:hypothetical protein
VYHYDYLDDDDDHYLVDDDGVLGGRFRWSSSLLWGGRVLW